MHQPIILLQFCRKLHKNERIWTEKGCISLVSHLDPSLLPIAAASQVDLDQFCNAFNSTLLNDAPKKYNNIDLEANIEA